MSVIRTMPEKAPLLDAFVDKLRDRLVRHALDAIRPAVVHEVEQVIRELKPTIEQHYDMRKDELVLHLTVKEPKP